MAFTLKNRVKVASLIDSRTEFKHASMSGRWVTSEDFAWGSYGKLPQEDVSTLRNLLKDRDLYIVYSYRTPIAYAYDREIHLLPQRYSVTTGHHQSIVALTDHYSKL